MRKDEIEDDDEYEYELQTIRLSICQCILRQAKEEAWSSFGFIRQIQEDTLNLKAFSRESTDIDRKKRVNEYNKKISEYQKL
jgi:hypothetical protein